MARKTKFHFNSETLSYERIETTIGSVFKKIGLHVLTSLVMGGGFFLLLMSFIDSPGEKQLRSETETLKAQYELLQRRQQQMQLLLTDLQQRDDNLYRVVFQAEPLHYAIRHTNASTQRYDSLNQMANSQLMISATRMADDLEKQIFIQSRSYDELMHLAKTQEMRIANLPAIQPIQNKDLKHMASGYGLRIDPIYHTQKMHHGMDFAAAIGTDVYATGNGIISFAGWQQGFGNLVKIDHNFGYETYYAHMNAIHVRVGQKVQRGDIIGEVGNTGKSTGPHLHYEVHINGIPQNPSKFYFLDLTPEEYDRMMQLSQNAGQVFD